MISIIRKGGIILNKNNVIIGAIVSIVISILFFAYSGIDSEMMLSPISKITSVLAENSELNYVYIIFGILIFPASLAITSVYSIRAIKKDYFMVIAPMISTILIFYFAGLSLNTFVVSLGFILCYARIVGISFSDKEHYKKISPTKISSGAANKGIFIFDVAIALAVFLALSATTMHAETTIDDLLTSTAGLSLEDINSLDRALADQQREASYAFIEGTEQALLLSIQYNSGEMNPSERLACMNFLQNSMDEVDESAKAEIDRQLEGGSLTTAGSQMEQITSLVNMFISTYAIVMAVTIFATLEFFKTFAIVPITSVYSSLFWKIMGNIKTEEPSKNRESSEMYSQTPENFENSNNDIWQRC